MNMFRLLRADEIDCRIAQISGNGVSLLLYKDARCDQNILDETVGPFNWQREHRRDNANCVVSIWDEQKGQWISKEDTGTESNTEKEKGLASDSFKRACFNWGIGRELYSAPQIFVTDCNITERNGRPACYDKFSVSLIDYDKSGNISALEIINAKTGRTVYRMGQMAEAKSELDYKAARDTFTPKCKECGAEIPDNVHDYSVKKYGVPLCRNCQKKR